MVKPFRIVLSFAIRSRGISARIKYTIQIKVNVDAIIANLFDTLIKLNGELLPCIIHISVLLVSSCLLQDTFVLITMFTANLILVC